MIYKILEKLAGWLGIIVGHIEAIDFGEVLWGLMRKIFFCAVLGVVGYSLYVIIY